MIGIDIDEEALKIAEEKYKMKVLSADLNFSLPFENNSFDFVVAGELLEHLPIPIVVLSEINRVLKDGNSYFIGSVPIVYHLQNRLRVLRGKRLDYDRTHCHYFSYDSLLETLSEHFIIEKMVAIEGQKWAYYSMRLFARHVTFCCKKK